MENDKEIENKSGQNYAQKAYNEVFSEWYAVLNRLIGLPDEDCYILAVKKVYFELLFIAILGILAVFIKVINIDERFNKILLNSTSIVQIFTSPIVNLFTDHLKDFLSNFSFILIYLDKLNIKNFIDIQYYIENVSNMAITKEFIIASIVGIVVYAYFFEYIKKKGVLANVIDPGNKYEGILFPSINGLLTNFFGIINLFLILYLVVKQAYIETFIIIFMGTIFTGSIREVSLATIKSLYDYSTLDNLNKHLIGIGIPQRKYIENYYRKSLKIIFASTIIWMLVSLYYNFNIITMLFIETVFIVWYFNINLIQYIPNHKVKLIDNLLIDEALIIRDSSQDYKLLLTKNNEQYAMVGDSLKMKDDLLQKYKI